MRRELSERYGEQKLYEGGLSVRTTLDPKIQLMARKALVDGLVRYDEAHGWHGAIKTIDLGQDWGVPLADIPAYGDIQPWRLAVALDVANNGIRIGLQPDHDKSGAVVQDRQTGTVTADGLRWTGRAPKGLVKPGDVFYVEPMAGRTGEYRLRQIPEVSGACIAMDPFTGRVLAMVGGFSFDESEFNRATQAQRQPGSSFKPFVYAAALDNGYTPSSILLDEPVTIDQGNGELWTPANFEGKSGGPHTLRFGVEHSINQMTVRLARDIGMPLVVEYAKRFGIYDNLPPFLSMAIGAGETTVLRMITGYSMFANGGKRVRATLIDRIQDRWGNTIYKHDERICEGCDAPNWENQPEPRLIDKREQVIDPLSAYQITSIMQGVIERGTGIAIKEVGKQLAGKTGTTNDAKDLWFVGFSPESRLRRVHGLRQAAFARRQRPGRALHRADLPRLHEDGAEGYARHAVPRAARHQADLGRRPFRHARHRARDDPRSVQAGNRTARQLWRRRRRRGRRRRGRSAGVGRAVGRLRDWRPLLTLRSRRRRPPLTEAADL